VAEAESGAHAIAYLKENRVDLIFSDVCMSEGTGYELLDWLKRYYANPPALVLVSGETSLCADDAVKRGAYALVEKPFQIKDLRALAETLKAETVSGLRRPPSFAS
jgi:CheY-like chemotaxis protein